MEKMAALREKSKKNGGAYSVKDVSQKMADLSIKSREEETGKKMSYDEKLEVNRNTYDAMMGINNADPRDY